MREQDPQVSYGRWSLFQRWTSTGVVAIAISGLGFLAVVSLVAYRYFGESIHLEVPGYLLQAVMLLACGATFLGLLTGLIAMFAGTADGVAWRDATLGLIAVLLSAGEFVLIVCAIAFSRY